jgi:hypothetical protein
MPDEHELRVASDRFLARVVRLEALESRKRELQPGTEEMVAAAQEVETLVREILELARTQTSLADGATRDPDAADLPPIAVTPPRALPVILAEWRAAERRLAAEPPGTAAWESARADVDRLRDEYALTFQLQRRQDGAPSSGTTDGVRP